MPGPSLPTVIIAAVVHLAGLAVVACLWAIGVMSNEVGVGLLSFLLGVGGGAGGVAIATGTTTATSSPATSDIGGQVAAALHNAAASLSRG